MLMGPFVLALVLYPLHHQTFKNAYEMIFSPAFSWQFDTASI